MFRPSADSHGTIRIRIRTSPLPLALLPRVRAAVPVAVDRRTRTVTTLLSVFFLVLLAANGVHSRPSPTPVVTITSLNVDDTSPCDSAKQLRVQLWEREVTNNVETQEWILIEYDVYHGKHTYILYSTAIILCTEKALYIHDRNSVIRHYAFAVILAEKCFHTKPAEFR